MKKKLILTLVAAAGILLLSACTSSDNTQSGSSGTAPAPTPSGTAQTIIGTPVTMPDAPAEGNDTAGAPAASDANGTSGDTPLAGSDNSGTTVSGTDTSVSDGSAGTAENGSSDEEDNEEVYVEEGQDDDEDFAPADEIEGVEMIPSQGDSAQPSANEVIEGEFHGVIQDGVDLWTGVYEVPEPAEAEGETETEKETVTLTKVDDGHIAFAFSLSGISGTAEIKEKTSAVYKGDDLYVVEFVIHDDTLTVNVSSEEDFDASSSPLIGTYEKQVEN